MTHVPKGHVSSSPTPRCRGWLRGAIVQLLVLALVLSLVPAPAHAAWTDKSGSLPGMLSGAQGAAVIAGGAAAAGVLLYLIIKHRKGAPKVNLDTPPADFTNVVVGEPVHRTVEVTNLMQGPVTVRAITVEKGAKTFQVDPGQLPHTLAPGEKFPIPITLNATSAGRGKGHLRIVSTTENLEQRHKEGVNFLKLSYGH